ncbi:hypothetical protein PBI_SQUIRTY_29 [Mycobacterium phage Squirty]|uniref:Uncharacterized protein n=1 Tax=Mycobacterium phage Squirty TaxID=1527512 RepID=A0A088FBH0_9CAUD|nr:hypothetical protein PBI_SQUIRTY_29 [Mycobacterium phage Squirty]AIM40976.1 hypothetical protein PBI_SQUIRTY_29 [Mycobacterium phage Squirty]
MENRPSSIINVAPAWSKGELKRLGEALFSGTATPEQHARYNEVMLWHNELAAEVAATLYTTDWQACPSELFDITARPKTIDTLIQKLQRERSMSLDEVQDLAGVRIDADIDLKVQTALAEEIATPGEPPQMFALGRADYDAARPDDEIEETSQTFEVEAQMSAIDFDDPTRWRVKTTSGTRNVTVEDEKFLGRVARGLAIRQQDIFWLEVREDAIVKNGRKRTNWVVTKVENRTRRVASDNESRERDPASP